VNVVSPPSGSVIFVTWFKASYSNSVARPRLSIAFVTRPATSTNCRLLFPRWLWTRTRSPTSYPKVVWWPRALVTERICPAAFVANVIEWLSGSVIDTSRPSASNAVVVVWFNGSVTLVTRW